MGDRLDTIISENTQSKDHVIRNAGFIGKRSAANPGRLESDFYFDIESDAGDVPHFELNVYPSIMTTPFE